ncbi:hypothetical protein AXG93_269s1000 [Marchantia polymorpha subsp. ruderalis]|uniref:Uncharacterized protein n=2 Tax=Marchantia polymorpha TaxID=3197 RepID=A0A176W260_MARPO|nr:hypothetical protein AXG93_269s1000 [Marchantia polymorpha subsp. ruderalis]
MDLDHPDHRGLQLHASKIHHIPDGCFHYHETDSRSHGFSHAVSLLEVSFGEADALLAFKEGIGNYSEGALDDWTPGKRSDYCSWTGVTCNRQLHVTALNLSSLDLTGSLGSSLCNLTFLEELHLDQNFLQGEIPPELGRLSRLRILKLEDNWLQGSIPKELGNLTSLQILNLGSQGSRFNGTIPEELGQLSELQFLNLGSVYNWDPENPIDVSFSNELRGTIPRSLGNCTKLWYLDFLSNKHLTGVIPEEVGKLIHLEYLSFELNNFTGAIPDQLGNLTRCKYLNFGSNALQGHLPVGLANLSRLNVLDVTLNFFTGNFFSSTSWSELSGLYASGNSFTGPFPELVLFSRNLVTLDLSRNNFSGNLPTDLGRLSSAKSIFMDRNMFGGELPRSLTNISLLTGLNLGGNKFTGPLDALSNSTFLESLILQSEYFLQNKFTGRLSDAMVRSWSNMRFLQLNDNALIGKIPKTLGNMTQLLFLFLHGNKFDGGIPEELGDLKKLLLVWLNDNKLTGEIPASLGNLQNVQQMNLGDNNLTLTTTWFLGLHRNHLTGEIPPDLGNLRSLAFLYLFNNNLTGNIPVTLHNCSGLQIIRLSHNSLRGPLTNINFSALEHLSVWSASGNKFSGLFPVEIWKCSFLDWLDLSNNHLLGVMPKFVGLNIWSRLRVLSLGSNYFSGSIPSLIWKLPALQVLDLSSNAFTGELPQNLSGLISYKIPLEVNRMSWITIPNMNRDVIISLRKGKPTLEYVYLFKALALLDISSNQLTGELPTDLGTLKYLFMDDNDFKGSIPPELEEIADLLGLDLSRNQLSGPIPVSLSKLRLSYLNLSLNQLSGPIPVANSFNTRYSESFLPGNPKLCGDSIYKPCESFAFIDDGELDPSPVTQRTQSWSLYFHGISVTDFAIGASIGFSTVIGLVTLIPSLRNRFLFQNIEPSTMLSLTMVSLVPT